MAEISRNGYIVIGSVAVAIGVAGVLYWYYFIRTPEEPPVKPPIKPPNANNGHTGCQSYLDCLPTEQCKDGVCVPLEQWDVPKPPAKPNPPTDLKATVAPDQPIKVSWTAPVANEAKISGYRIYRTLDYGYYKETEIYGKGTQTKWDDTLRRGKVGQFAKTITYQVSAVAKYENILKGEPDYIEGEKSNAVTVEIAVPEEYKAITGTATLTVTKAIRDRYGDITQRIPIPGVEITLENVSTPITKKTDAKGVVVFDNLYLHEDGTYSSYPFTLKYYGQEAGGKGMITVSKGSPNYKGSIDTNWNIIVPEQPLVFAQSAAWKSSVISPQPINPFPFNPTSPQ